MTIELSVVLPVFNERDAIEGVVKSIQEEMKNFGCPYEIIAVDDGSSDGSTEVLKGISGLKVLTHEINIGYGGALKTGIRGSCGRKSLIMDADRSYPAEAICRMLEKAEHFDMVVGCRKHVFDLRSLARTAFRLTASVLMGTKIPDLNSGMRVIDSSLAKRYAKYLPDGFSASSTLTAIFLRKKHSIHYMNIPYHPRIGISKLRIIPDAFRFFYFILTRWRRLHP